MPLLFRHMVAQAPDAIMMRQKELGIWEGQTRRQVGEIVDHLTMGLIKLGAQADDVVSILSNTSREWVFTDIAAQCAGGIVNGIYPTDAASQVEYLCQDSSTKVLFVEDEEQLDKFLEVRDHLPSVTQVVVFDMKGLNDLNDPMVMSYQDLIALGRQHLSQDILSERLAGRTPQDTAILVYTSGTTGRPKGVMLSHDNAVMAARSLQEFLPQIKHEERIAFLPLCHVGERVIGVYVAMLMGHVLNFVEDPETVFENLREVQPGMFSAVPRVWEKLYSSMMIALREGTPLQRWAFNKALGVGEKHMAARAAGNASAFLQLQFWLAKVLVLNNIKRAMGLNRIELAVTGAAPISPDLIKWYGALGIEVLELWGMSELCGASTMNPPGAMRPGSIGIPLPHTQVKISDEGEIMVKSPQVFTGYLNQPEKTAEMFNDGWLLSGDVGRQDEDGYFYITDRMKDIIITAGGKNITPSEWENQLKFSPYVTDAVVIGDKRAYLTCLIMIDQENVEQWAQENNVQFSDYRSLTRSTEVVALIQAEMDAANAKFARAEQVKMFRLIDTQLTAEDEELTPTMKLKRKMVHSKYSAMIEEMYTKAN